MVHCESTVSQRAFACPRTFRLLLGGLLRDRVKGREPAVRDASKRRARRGGVRSNSLLGRQMIEQITVFELDRAQAGVQAQAGLTVLERRRAHGTAFVLDLDLAQA